MYRIEGRVPDPERGEGGQGDGVLRGADRRCSAGERCASHAALGEPAKLSRSNPGPTCFACGERSAASEIGGAAKPAAILRDERGPLTQAEGRSSEVRTGRVRKAHACSEGHCERLAVEGHPGERVCREHAEARRAREWQKGRAEWALTCGRNLREALAAGDGAIARKWAALSEEAGAALARAQADLAAAEARARSEPDLSYDTPWRAGAYPAASNPSDRGRATSR